MKSTVKYIIKGVAGVTIASGLWSCAAESPFESEGIGTVCLHTTINTATTRAVTGYTDEELADKCMVYISRKNGKAATGDKPDGLVYRKQGLGNVDPQIMLKPGNYAAEAWTGDSVAASYDKKFFRGYQDFEVSKGNITTVNLNCKIQNVVVSFDPNSTALPLMNENFTITIHNGTADLMLDKTNLKGYFMVPDGEGEESLGYTIKATRKEDGNAIERKGTIANVQRACEYKLVLDYNPPSSNLGGTSSFDINIEEENVGGEGESNLANSEPTITGVGFDIATTLDYSGSALIPNEIGVTVCAVGNGFKSAAISGTASINLLEATSLPEGIEFTTPSYDKDKNVTTAFLLFKKSYIEQLSTGEHAFKISVTDNSSEEGKTTEKTLTIKR